MVVGDWHSELHEETVYQALKELGHEVIKFSWHQYFKSREGRFRFLDSILKRAQNKYLLGPLVSGINRDFLAAVMSEKPDAVFIYRGTHIFPATLCKARETGAVVVGYNNDDPFSPTYPHWMWRHFLKGVPEYDLVLAYRKHNLDDFLSIGARRVELLRSWYMPSRNFPVQLTAEEEGRFGCDVVFVGHYEDDGRVALLEEIVHRNWCLKLFGPGYDWDPVIRNSPMLQSQIPVKLVWGVDYNKALCGAKIALCFFSKLNRDTYTRRCFEIPATGTMMLSEYSDDLAGLFKEGKEAEFFRSEEEMMEKISYYLRHDEKRRSIAEAGYARVQSDGHDVVSRMRQFCIWIDEIRGKKHG